MKSVVRVLALFAVPALLLPSAGLAQTKDPRSVAGALYARLDKLYADGDATLIGTYFDDNIVVTSPVGKWERAGATAEVRKGIAASEQRLSTTTIVDARFAGGSLIARVYSVVDASAHPGGTLTTQHEELHKTDTWRPSGDAWRLVESRVEDIKRFKDGAQIFDLTRADGPQWTDRPSLVRALEALAHPLASLDPAGDQTDLWALEPAIGDARIVGVGEGTHGTSEFFRLKHRILRYLVERKGFTVLALELPWSSALAIDKYVKGGEGDAKLLRDAPAWYNEEVWAFAQWLREYNAAHKDRLVSVVGVDIFELVAPVTRVIEFTRKVLSPSQNRVVLNAYSCLAAKETAATPQGRANCLAAVKYVRTMFDTISIRDERERQVALHAATVVVEVVTMWQGNTLKEKFLLRDAAMADNVDWLARRLYPTEKIAISAHSGHVSATAFGPIKPMGSYLRAEFGASYVALGCTFDHGSLSPDGVHAPFTMAAAADFTSEAVLREVNLPLYYLDLHQAAAMPLASKWLARDVVISLIGSEGDRIGSERDRITYSLNLPKSFDALFVVKEAHAAHSFLPTAATNE